MVGPVVGGIIVLGVDMPFNLIQFHLELVANLWHACQGWHSGPSLWEILHIRVVFFIRKPKRHDRDSSRICNKECNRCL
ncbi:hypothetical protein GDO86_000115 [Hymenochirus boettgeri]|uniref:Uncharacterized protein n=1 Tax=Hymenochirus boettgeri TaxID=247094 RepID=A0A8T2K771_9PIPI|nr:hypothetical protein GDO86_000115 [Hymenochirus boettgeri]